MEVKFCYDSQPNSFLVIEKTSGIKTIASAICLSIIFEKYQFHA